jgi:putative DNA primase/helicase
MATEPVDLAELRRRLEEGDPFTEDALARRFSLRHGHDLRYIAIRGQWLRWDGARWHVETTLLAFDLVRESCKQDGEDYANMSPPKALYSAKTVAAVEHFARADRRHATTIDQWDAHEFLLNADSATFDLRTGSGREPNPADYLTKKTACAVAPPGTPHPLWDAFLARIAPDDELRAFLKRFCGYCLTGVTTEHKFVFAWGTGANGKSVLVNTVSAILGDYATVADVGTFIASNSDRHPTDIAKLHGYRLAVAQDSPPDSCGRISSTLCRSSSCGSSATTNPTSTMSMKPCGGACCWSPFPCRFRPRNATQTCSKSSRPSGPRSCAG